MNPLPKAVLKPPQSKRYRDHPASPNFAKRLDCGTFTAAFAGGLFRSGWQRCGAIPKS